MDLSKEQLLVKALKEGDHLAFDSLFNLYFDRLFRFAVSILKDRNDAEEIVQDVFVKVWQKRNEIKLHYSFKSFLFSVSYNMIISALRKKRRDRESFSSLLDEMTVATQESADSNLIYLEQLEQIEATIDRIPSMRKKIFCMSRYEGLSYAEIASTLGIAKNTVENQISAALKFLREELGNRGIAILLVLFIYFG